MTTADRFEAMRAFLAVADTGGFTAAARQLSVSAATVTRQVAGLERSLGVQLLHRSTRSVRLTRAGESYRPLARETLERLEVAEQAARAESAALAGSLRIAAPLVFGRLHAAPVIAEFMATHPQVRVELLLATDFARLIEDGIDIAIRVGELPDSGLLTRSLGVTRQVLAASPAYLARHGAPGTPDQLTEHRLIGFEGVSPRRQWRFAHYGAEIATKVDPVLFSDNAEAAVAAAARGAGIICALRYQIAAELGAGHLVEVLADFAPSPTPIQAVLPASRFVSPTVRALADHLVRARGRWQGL